MFPATSRHLEIHSAGICMEVQRVRVVAQSSILLLKAFQNPP